MAAWVFAVVNVALFCGAVAIARMSVVVHVVARVGLHVPLLIMVMAVWTALFATILGTHVDRQRQQTGY